MKHILIIMGTRPEAIKLIPVYLKLKKSDAVVVSIISTGQHKQMLDNIFSFFEIRPEIELDLMKPDQSLSQITALLFTHLSEAITKLNPALLVTQGDTTSAMVASVVGYYQRLPVVHVEAGLRTFNKNAPFPEEVNRRIISQVADISFAPTQIAYDNLMKESLSSVHIVGNTVVDALLEAQEKVMRQSEKYLDRFKTVNFNKKLILITAHRRESFGDSFQQICYALRALSLKYPDVEFVFPVHLNPNVQKPVHEILKGLSNMHLISPLPYDEMVFLMCKAHLILTDSGGIQEEAPTLQVPLIVLREVTERPEGIEAGCAVLAGTESKKIEDTFDRIYTDEARYNKMRVGSNPYGDGRAAERIARIMVEYLQTKN